MCWMPWQRKRLSKGATTMADEKKKGYAEEFAEKVIEGLKNGTAPFIKPWRAGELSMAHNPSSGTVYRGINQLMLSSSEFADPRWMTMNQANQEGYRVRKGSRAQHIVFWQFTEKQDVLDENGQPKLDEEGKKIRHTVELDRPRVKVFSVFNVSQLQNEKGEPYPAWEAKEPEWNPDEKAETIMENSGVPVFHDQADRAYYSPADDEIHMTPRENFPSAGNYYSTALHELGHATGHENRLNREVGKHPFGSEGYAKEELRAEIGSWMLSQELGLPHDPGNHLAYVDSWIQTLEKNPREIVSACRDAEKIRDYVMELEKGKEAEVHPRPADVVEKSSQQAVPEQTQAASPQRPAPEKTFLAVPFKEKDAAKQLGAKWDRAEKKWFAPEGTDLAPLEKWLPAKEIKNIPPLPPQQEFAQALRNTGLIIEGDPVMDGKIQRVAVENGKPGARDGAYCAQLYTNGSAAGWLQNHKTSTQEKCVATGHALSTEQKQSLRKDAELQKEARQQEIQAEQQKAMKRAYAKWMNAEPASKDHPYLQNKGVDASNLRQDKQGNLLVPGWNEQGRLQTLQMISPTGGKWYEKGCPKSGAFCMIEDKNAEKSTEEKDKNTEGEILIAEGYATGASLHQATGIPVAIAFDASNLKEAAQAIRAKMPKVAITICADDDHSNAAGNIGVEKAKEAANLVGGKVVKPAFSKEDKARGMTDFNDLHKGKGLGAVKKSVDDQRKKQQAEVER